MREVTSSGFAHELTNWSNLLQGSLGALIGAFVAGLLGVWTALHTIRRTHESQRLLERERQSLDLSQELSVLVGRLATRVRLTRDIEGRTGKRSTSISFDEPATELLDWHSKFGPSLPPFLDSRLNKLTTFALVVSTTQDAWKRGEPTDEARLDDLLKALSGAVEDTRDQITEYRRDPDKQLVFWQRESRQESRRLRQARVAWRMRHPLKGGKRPELLWTFGADGISSKIGH